MTELALLQSLLTTGLPFDGLSLFSLPAKYYPHHPRSSTKRQRAAVATPERYVALLHNHRASTGAYRPDGKVLIGILLPATIKTACLDKEGENDRTREEKEIE
jgi:hypothetical protein